MMKNRMIRGQLQMGETIFVVFFIVIIIVFGLVFYGNVQQEKIREDKVRHNREALIERAHVLASWPELGCSSSSDRELDCIDLLKLKTLSDFINKSRMENSFAFRYYSDILGRSSVVVSQIYPEPLSNEGVWIVYDFSGNRSSKETVFNPVKIHDPFSGDYFFGLMELSVYE